MLALSLLLVSSIPLVSAVECGLPDLNMSGMNMLDMEMQAEATLPQIDGQDCYIECSCHVGNQLGGIPHQLAPYALSLVESEFNVSIADVDMATVPALKPRHLFFPPPPPIIS